MLKQSHELNGISLYEERENLTMHIAEVNVKIKMVTYYQNDNGYLTINCTSSFGKSQMMDLAITMSSESMASLLLDEMACILQQFKSLFQDNSLFPNETSKGDFSKWSDEDFLKLKENIQWICRKYISWMDDDIEYCVYLYTTNNPKKFINLEKYDCTE